MGRTSIAAWSPVPAGRMDLLLVLVGGFTTVQSSLGRAEIRQAVLQSLDCVDLKYQG